MELELYRTALFLAGAVNLLIALALLHNNVYFRVYDVYYRSRWLVTVNYAIFGIGFLLHAHFGWRTVWPEAASALTVSYFHSGGVLFGWSHISLMRPNYLTRRVVVRDLAILVVGLVCYWTTATCFPLSTFHFSFLIFFLHAAFIAFTFYHTYYNLHRSMELMPTDGNIPGWWTPDTKRTVLGRHHAFVIGCHLIVVFGLGSVALTAAFPRAVWLYIVLMLSGIAVFCFIFYSIVEYGNVIDSATCATEDAK